MSEDRQYEEIREEEREPFEKRKSMFKQGDTPLIAFAANPEGRIIAIHSEVLHNCDEKENLMAIILALRDEADEIEKKLAGLVHPPQNP